MTTFKPQSETPDPGWCGDRKRGASMGRASAAPNQWEGGSTIVLHRIHLDSQGYDPGGAYWGSADSTSGYLWEAACLDIETGEDDSPHYFFRAKDRATAETHLRNLDETFVIAPAPKATRPDPESLTMRDMEIEVTDFIRQLITGDEGAEDYTGRGSSGHAAFDGACYVGQGMKLTPANLEALRQYFATFGCWEDEEINEWSDAELAGLLVQETTHWWSELGEPTTMAEYLEGKETAGGHLGPDDEEKEFADCRWYFYAGE